MMRSVPAAIKSQQDALEKARIELSSYFEMHERGTPDVTDGMVNALPGQIAREMMILDDEGILDQLDAASTREIIDITYKALVMSITYSTVALELITQRIVDTDEMQAVIKQVGVSNTWTKRDPTDPS